MRRAYVEMNQWIVQVWKESWPWNLQNTIIPKWGNSTHCLPYIKVSVAARCHLSTGHHSLIFNFWHCLVPLISWATTRFSTDVFFSPLSFQEKVICDLFTSGQLGLPLSAVWRHRNRQERGVLWYHIPLVNAQSSWSQWKCTFGLESVFKV